MPLDFEEAQAGLKAWHHCAHRARLDVLLAFERALCDYVQTADPRVLDAFSKEHEDSWPDASASRIALDAAELDALFTQLADLSAALDLGEPSIEAAHADLSLQADVNRLDWERLVLEVKLARTSRRASLDTPQPLDAALHVLSRLVRDPDLERALRRPREPRPERAPACEYVPSTHSERLQGAFDRCLSPFASVGLGRWFSVLPKAKRSAWLTLRTFGAKDVAWHHELDEEMAGRIALGSYDVVCWAAAEELESLLVTVDALRLTGLKRLSRRVLSNVGERGASRGRIEAVAAGLSEQFDVRRARLLREGAAALEADQALVSWVQRRGL